MASRDAGGSSSGVVDAAPMAAELRRTKRPWLTVLLSIAIGFASIVAQTVAVIASAVVLVVTRPGQNASEVAARAGSDGDFIAFGAWGGTLVAVPLILLVAKRQAFTSAAELLGCKVPTVRQIVVWLGALLLFVAVSDGLTSLSGRAIVPRIMQDVYASANAPILLWATLIVAAPLFEELLFRGLLFQALLDTRLKAIGAVAITSLLWSAIHVQYDLYGIASIFVGGLLLGAARHVTGSVFLCMLMHATMNLIATLQVIWLT